MSKSMSGWFSGTKGSESTRNESFQQIKIKYNPAGSKSVKQVNSILTTHDVHSILPHGTPNSVSRNYKNGKLVSERYYDQEGNAYLDIDYTDHGNRKMHPNVPHEHDIHFENKEMIREDEIDGGIRK